MPAFATFRRLLAGGAMAVAALCGIGKVLAKETGAPSVMQVRGGEAVGASAYLAPEFDLPALSATIEFGTRPEDDTADPSVLTEGDADDSDSAQPFRASVMDGEVLAAPAMRKPVIGGAGEIAGTDSMEEARNFAMRPFAASGGAGLVVMRTCLAANPRAPPPGTPIVNISGVACD